MKLNLIFLLTLASCAHQQMVAPSGAGVTSGLGRTGASITQAQKWNDVVAVHNQKAMTNVERIDAKARVLERYWK